MTFLDWVLIVVWLGVFLSGFWKGAIRIVFGLGGFLAGLSLAVAVGGELAQRLHERIAWVWLADVLGRLAPILACVLLGLVAGWGLERTLRALHLNWLNRLAGAVLAGVLAALLLGVLLLAGARVSPTWASVCQTSRIAPLLMRVPSAILGGQDDAAAGVGVAGRSTGR